MEIKFKNNNHIKSVIFFGLLYFLHNLELLSKNKTPFTFSSVLNSLWRGMFFSLITQTTVGYGTWAIQGTKTVFVEIVVMLQLLTLLMFKQ